MKAIIFTNLPAQGVPKNVHSEMIYTTWMRESKVGFIFEQPCMADTKAIDINLQSYESSVKNNESLDQQTEKLNNALTSVETWLKNQDKALFPQYSDRYTAAKQLQARLEVMKAVSISAETLTALTLKLGEVLHEWKQLVEDTLSNYKNITGINQMAKVFNN